MSVLDEFAVRAALLEAWQDSRPGITGGHEEGGAVLQDPNGEIRTVRWQAGCQSSISLPGHSDCKIGDCDIIATFHTHPNTDIDYLQAPSETDKRSVRDDRDLKGRYYEGEYVISQHRIFLITPDGQVKLMGSTVSFLAHI